MALITKKVANNFLFILIFLFFTACNGKFPGADARKFPANPAERVKKNLAEGKGATKVEESLNSQVLIHYGELLWMLLILCLCHR